MRIDEKAAPVARRIHKRGQQKKVHLFGGPKCDGLVQLESRLEVIVAVALTVDPRVHAFRPQPEIPFPQFAGIPGAAEAENRNFRTPCSNRLPVYTPDFSVTLVTGEEVLIEAKHSGLIAKKPEILDLPMRFAATGRKLVIVTEQEIPHTLEQNLRLLAPLSHPPMPVSVREAVLALVPDGPCRCNDVIARLADGQRTVLQAIAQGHLTCDLRHARLGPATSLAQVSARSGTLRPCLEILSL